MPSDIDHVPSSEGAPPQCPDCSCAPHRHANPERDKDCPRCGCPNLRVAKKERDEGLAGAHMDSGRNTNPGFY